MGTDCWTSMYLIVGRPSIICLALSVYRIAISAIYRGMNPTIAPEGLSITEALSALEPKGYTGQFVPRVADESITMRCTTCNELYDPSLLQTGDVLRVE